MMITGRLVSTRASRGIGIVALVLLAEVFPASQGGQAVPATRSAAAPRAVRAAVSSFLRAWLLEQNLGRAMSFFGKGAFENEAMLEAPCAAYIRHDDRGSASARRAGVQAFLRDFLPAKRVTGLGEVLSKEELSGLADSAGSALVNDPNADLFVLVQLRIEQLPFSQSADAEPEAGYLRKRLPSNSYVSFVPIGQGIVYFVWAAEGGEWRIYHASLACM